MKPFDLEAAKQGEPIQTRDGRPAKFIAFVPEAPEHTQVISLVENHDESVIRLSYSDGLRHKVYASPNDLFMAPKKRTVWINLYEYPNASDRYDAFAYDSEETANNSCCAGRVGGKAWPLEIME